MKAVVCPELSTAAAGSSQAPTAAVDNSAPSSTHPEPTYKSGKVVQTTGTTYLQTLENRVRSQFTRPDLGNRQCNCGSHLSRLLYRLSDRPHLRDPRIAIGNLGARIDKLFHNRRGNYLPRFPPLLSRSQWSYTR